MLYIRQCRRFYNTFIFISSCLAVYLYKWWINSVRIWQVVTEKLDDDDDNGNNNNNHAAALWNVAQFMAYLIVVVRSYLKRFRQFLLIICSTWAIPTEQKNQFVSDEIFHWYLWITWPLTIAWFKNTDYPHESIFSAAVLRYYERILNRILLHVNGLSFVHETMDSKKKRLTTEDNLVVFSNSQQFCLA